MRRQLPKALPTEQVERGLVEPIHGIIFLIAWGIIMGSFIYYLIVNL
jgi:hypothetical protein